jgi:hypothetical protein
MWYMTKTTTIAISSGKKVGLLLTAQESHMDPLSVLALGQEQLTHGLCVSMFKVATLTLEAQFAVLFLCD